MVHLIDTPAFGSDDEGPPDIDSLKDIAFWLGKSYDAQVLLNGIIYLHPITSRISDSTKAKFKLFKALCGEASLRSVLLVTTMWDSLGNPEDGMRRHVELIQRAAFWGETIAGGSQTRRYLGHKDSAIKILSYLCEKKEKTVLAIQRQLVESGDLSKTDAGEELLHEISQRITAYEKSLNDLEAQMERALEDNNERQCADLAAVRDGYFSKVNAAIAARDGLTVNLFDLYYQKGAEDAIAEILRGRETSQQVMESGKRGTYEAQQYDESVEREEMSDHNAQAAEREATQATGKGKGLLMNEARLMSEGLEQHPWDITSESQPKRENSQALRSEALEQERKQLEEAVHAQLQRQQQERKQLEEGLHALRPQLQEDREKLQRQQEQERKELVEVFCAQLREEREQLEQARVAQLQHREVEQLEEAFYAQLQEEREQLEEDCHAQSRRQRVKVELRRKKHRAVGAVAAAALAALPLGCVVM